MTGQEWLDRVAAVLREHQFRITGYSDQPMCCGCQEGCTDNLGHMKTMQPQDHPEHVAAMICAAVVAELDRPAVCCDNCGEWTDQ